MMETVSIHSPEELETSWDDVRLIQISVRLRLCRFTFKSAAIEILRKYTSIPTIVDLSLERQCFSRYESLEENYELLEAISHFEQLYRFWIANAYVREVRGLHLLCYRSNISRTLMVLDLKLIDLSEQSCSLLLKALETNTALKELSVIRHSLEPFGIDRLFCNKHQLVNIKLRFCYVNEVCLFFMNRFMGLQTELAHLEVFPYGDRRQMVMKSLRALCYTANTHEINFCFQKERDYRVPADYAETKDYLGKGLGLKFTILY